MRNYRCIFVCEIDLAMGERTDAYKNENSNKLGYAETENIALAIFCAKEAFFLWIVAEIFRWECKSSYECFIVVYRLYTTHRHIKGKGGGSLQQRYWRFLVTTANFSMWCISIKFGNLVLTNFECTRWGVFFTSPF